MQEIPKVVIVGRPNVGKSSLFNAILRRQISIVDRHPGVTRDLVSAQLTHEGKSFELIDSGGIGLPHSAPFSRLVQDKIDSAIQQAQILLFVLDAQEGLTPLDQQISRTLRKSGKRVIPVANKFESPRYEKQIHEFSRLGWGTPARTSAVHRKGIQELLDLLTRYLPSCTVGPSHALKIAIIGRKNVGKSTLLNTLAGQQRSIVSEIPGTTRDSIDVLIQRDERIYRVIDTAGLRKRRTRLADSVELFSSFRAHRAIKQADVVVLLLDATEGVTTGDKNIAGLIEAEYKPTIIVINKWDLMGSDTTDLINDINSRLHALSYAPVLIISALKGLHIDKILPLADELYTQASQTVPTPRLNRLLEAIRQANPPSARGTRTPKIYYVTQVGICPPRLLIFVNDTRLFTSDYIRYLKNQLRQRLPYSEVPIKLEIRK